LPRVGGGGGGYIGSPLLGRTVMIVSVMAIVGQMAYSLCHADVTVELQIYIPPSAKISKWQKPRILEPD